MRQLQVFVHEETVYDLLLIAEFNQFREFMFDDLYDNTLNLTGSQKIDKIKIVKIASVLLTCYGFGIAWSQIDKICL